jgi:hypothetical protein
MAKDLLATPFYNEMQYLKAEYNSLADIGNNT